MGLGLRETVSLVRSKEAGSLHSLVSDGLVEVERAPEILSDIRGDEILFDFRSVDKVELVISSRIVANYEALSLAGQDCPLSDSDACQSRQRGASFFHTLSFVARGFLI